METKVLGTFSEVSTMMKIMPGMSFDEYEKLVEGRPFSRWYRKNKKVIDMLLLTTPGFAMKLFHISPIFLFGTLLPPLAVPVAGTFFSGHGVILLHMLIVGFLTLVVTSFLKFTGRGDLAPLVVFVGGGVILYECMQLFYDIYHGVETFFKM